MGLPLFDRAEEKEAEEAARGRPRDPERVWRVAEVNRAARALVETGLGEVWVEGELRNVRRQASGHVYFTLSDPDDRATASGVMFRSDAARTRARLEDGARVRLRGRPTLYEERGQFQIVARLAVPAGAGDLHAELELLKRKLAAEGLLSVERKRALPRLPRVVGVVTSRHGAALGDVIRVAAGRAPVRLVVADCRVQGPEAAPSLVAALARMARVPGLDVVIVGRGGGAAEDLWAFNDERVARAIAAFPVPVVSAVGHEQDVTVADLVADVRAATPSNAAELVVPDRAALLAELARETTRLERALDRKLARGRAALDRGATALAERDPRRALAAARAALEAALADAVGHAQRAVEGRRRALREAEARLGRQEPRARLARDRAALERSRAQLVLEGGRLVAARRALLDELAGRAAAEGRPAVERPRAELARLAAQLDALSPLRVLARGYAVALEAAEGGRALTDAGALAPGDAVRVRLHRGAFRARVTDVEPPEDG